MSNYYRYRRLYRLKDFFRNAIQTYGKRSLIVFIVGVIGIIMGSIVMAGLIEGITIDNVADVNFLSFLQREKNCFAMFIVYLFWYAVLIVFTLIVNKNLFFHILNIMIVFIVGFCLGYNFVLYVSIFNVIATIFLIIIYPFFNLLFLAIYSFILGIIWTRNREKRLFGRVCYTSCNNHQFLLIIWLIVILVSLLFLYSLFLNIFKLFVVID